MQSDRVLIVNDYDAFGGAEQVYRSSLETLRAIPGVEVEKFDKNDIAEAGLIANPAWNIRAARALDEKIRRFRPNRVWVHNYHGYMSSSILGVIRRNKQRFGYKTYLTCHDYHLVFHNPLMLYYPRGRAVPATLDDLGTLRALLTRSSPRSLAYDALRKLHWLTIDKLVDPPGAFDLFLCPSLFMREALRRRGITNSVFFPNPVATAECSPRRAYRRDAGLHIAFVGRISPEKGIRQFIEMLAATQFRQVRRITLFGDGPDRRPLESRYASLIDDGRICFAGSMPHEQLFQRMRELDALVLPSTCGENAPLVIVEAAALGMPILVHDHGSMSTFGDEIGNKIKYAANAASLTAALESLADHLANPHLSYDISMYTKARYTEQVIRHLSLSEQVSAAQTHACGPIDNGAPIHASSH
jgi:glycosyltransferase involved in cell wall biosynthesis